MEEFDFYSKQMYMDPYASELAERGSFQVWKESIEDGKVWSNDEYTQRNSRWSSRVHKEKLTNLFPS